MLKWLRCGLALVAFSLLAPVAGAATLLPNGEQTFLDDNGGALANGTVTFYVPGTTTPKSTWQDSGQTIYNTNPVVLDSAGRAIIYGSGCYRQVVKDSLGNLIWDQLTCDTSASGVSWGGTSGGTANAQTVNASNFTSSDGQAINFIAGATNTAALTLDTGAGPISVLKDTSSGAIATTGGEVVTGNLIEVVYDSTRGAFHLVSLPPYFGVRTSIASASTTDLGTLGTRNALITGTTTISSFGSSATTAQPVYFLTFSGALTLTYNGTSMILPGGQNITTSANSTAIAMYLGSGNWQVLSYTDAATPLVATAPTYTEVTTTNTSFALTAGVKFVEVTMCGGGGGGGGVDGDSAHAAGAGGGGGGAGWWVRLNPVLGGFSTMSITIGAAGTGASAGANNGGNGGDTILNIGSGTIVFTAKGGGFGYGITGSSPSGSPLITGNGYGGAYASPTTTSAVVASTFLGAQSGLNGFALTSTVQSNSGAGAGSIFGTGGPGLGATGTGNTASGKCAGGSGGYSSVSPDYGGGAGGAGYAIVKQIFTN